MNLVSGRKLLFSGSTMKIQVISDLHQEFGFMDISFEDADLVILLVTSTLVLKGLIG
jgi:hypothetical protein